MKTATQQMTYGEILGSQRPMTFREHIAMHVMSVRMAGGAAYPDFEQHAAAQAVRCADMLIAELAKTQPKA